MSSFQKDSRFSKVLTDPRFLPMPTYERKVKIDKRFNALFTSKEFGHRHLQDKRGRPIHDVSKRSKHVMEQYYELSSDDTTSSSDDDDASATSSDPDLSEDDNDDENKQSSLKKTAVEKKKDKKSSKKKRAVPDSDEDSDDVVTFKPKPKKIKKEGNQDKEKEKCAKIKKGKKKDETEHTDDSEDDVDMDDQEPEQEEKTVKRKKKSKKASSKDSDDEHSQSDQESDEEDKEETSSSEDESSDDDDSNAGDVAEYTTEFDIEDTAIEHEWNELHKDAPVATDSTYRLAVCNMDWDFVKAQDLYILFKSFAGDGGSVHSVTIYPSEFGKERMAEEAVSGPKEMKENLGKEENMKKELEKKKRKKAVDGQVLKRMEKQIVNAEQEVLRNYQLNRLRYFYAVVVCSSVEVADSVYKELDGQEYQLSSVALDLRFIPDDMNFEGEYKEMFSEEQGLVDYTPKMFSSSALSQAKVEVTWDETEFDRLRKRMLQVQTKELVDIVEENRYADIIAPPESDSDDLDEGEDSRPEWLKSALAGQDDDDSEIDGEITEEKKIELYRQLLVDKNAEDEEKEKKENLVDKELSWQPGIKAAVIKGLKKDKKEESQGTLIDGYLEKKREKRKNKRDAKLESSRKDESSSDDDNDVDMPDIVDNSLKEMMEAEGVNVDEMQGKGKKNKKSKKKENKSKHDDADDDSEAEREKAELELLLMGDGDSKGVAKPEKVKKDVKLSRRQKRKQALQEREKKKKNADELTVDVNDQRFSAMFSSHHFHIDPTAPEFKKTQNMSKLVDEQIKRKTKHSKDERRKSALSNNGERDENNDSRNTSKKLVESLKKKMKKR